ncbi:hypothetical protein DPMN_045438 [Dreissena polymorpha]|uniref:Uncharacterized protein n=1 Tax=Dreissena polymorpha TaxID=45954 RepID=A0A9D4D522_DREPO|nr:hypothetical protein DPMN_045438 [Dreissena polymorpha]
MYGGKAVDYILTMVVVWLTWKLVRFIWKREEHKRIFADIPLLCHHWFWGITEEVKSVNDLTMIAQRFVEKTGAIGSAIGCCSWNPRCSRAIRIFFAQCTPPLMCASATAGLVHTECSLHGLVTVC